MSAARELLSNFDAVAEAPDGVQRLRELVLGLAYSARLVPHDPGTASAGALLESLGVEPSDRASLPALPSSWEWAEFGRITESRLGKMLDRAKNSGPLRPYLRNANVQWFRFDLESLLEIRLEDREYDEYSLQPGDLVVCEGGEPGRSAVCDESVAGMVFQKALHRARPLAGIPVWYLALFLRHATWQRTLDQHFTGATIKHLTGRSLKSVLVPLAPLEEQARIVAEVKALLRLCDELDRALATRDETQSAVARALARATIAGL
jgi:type I restriction enzyme, S subunit